MEKIINIAQIRIKFDFKSKKLLNAIEKIYSEYQVKKPDYDILIKLKYKKYQKGEKKLSAKIKDNKLYFEFIKISGFYDFKNKKGEFYIQDSEIAFYSLLRVIFSYSAPFFNAFYIHASAVFNTQYGIMATGISGAGKSTFAKTMSKQGFKVIHDDLVLIRKIDNKFYIFSIPFIKDPLFKFEKKQKIELTHLFFLGKSQNNTIKNMSTKEIYKNLMRMLLSFTELPICFHKSYLNLIGELIKATKISRLIYNPETIEIKKFL